MNNGILYIRSCKLLNRMQYKKIRRLYNSSLSLIGRGRKKNIELVSKHFEFNVFKMCTCVTPACKMGK